LFTEDLKKQKQGLEQKLEEVGVEIGNGTVKT
jgi:hypothetical protein